MTKNVHTIILILCMSIVTMFTRFISFFIFGGEKKVPDSVVYLGKYLQPAIITMLIVYCLKDIKFNVVPYGGPELFCIALVFLIQYFKKNTLLSILLGTICYMVLMYML